MIDRIIKFLVLCLGGLLIFLVGHLLTNDGDEQARPPQVEQGKTEPSPDDIATKRVKTVPVRPDAP